MEITKLCIRCEGTGFLSLSPKHGNKSPTVKCDVCKGTKVECYSDDELRALLAEKYPSINNDAIDWFMHLNTLEAVDKIMDQSDDSVVLYGFDREYETWCEAVRPEMGAVDESVKTNREPTGDYNNFNWLAGIIYKRESFTYQEENSISRTGGDARPIEAVVDRSLTLDEVKAILTDAVDTTNQMYNVTTSALAFHTLSNVVSSVVRKII